MEHSYNQPHVVLCTAGAREMGGWSRDLNICDDNVPRQHSAHMDNRNVYTKQLKLGLN